MIYIIHLLSFILLPLLGGINTNSYPEVLSPEEEEYHLNRLKNKDMDSRNILIEHNLRLVAHIVKRYENTKEDKEDLLSIGSLGLIKAVDTFNFNSTNKLSTYAARCIENEILMHLRSTKKNKQTLWLYSSIGTDKEGNEIKLCDVIEDPSSLCLESIIKKEHIENIQKALNVLDDREREIINLRYGLNGHIDLTQREIADLMKISRSYVSRIEKRALTKLYLELTQKK